MSGLRLEAAVPPELAVRMHEMLRAHGFDPSDVNTADVLNVVHLELTRHAAAGGAVDARDLLAIDGMITHALSGATDDPSELEALAGAELRRLIALGDEQR